MAKAKFKAGDVVEKIRGTAQYEILGIETLHGVVFYKVKVLKSGHSRRIGVTDRKSVHMVDNEYALCPMTRATLPDIDIDIDDEVFKAALLKCRSVAKSQCDCGGHKLGYSDDQLFGHGTWCKLVKLSKEKNAC